MRLSFRVITTHVFFIFVFLFVVSLHAAPSELRVSGKNFQTISGSCNVRLVGVNVCGLEWDSTIMGSPEGGGDIIQSVNNTITIWKSNDTIGKTLKPGVVGRIIFGPSNVLRPTGAIENQISSRFVAPRHNYLSVFVGAAYHAAHPVSKYPSERKYAFSVKARRGQDVSLINRKDQELG